jgi:hypothetical protein
MREREPDVERHQPGLRAGAEKGETDHEAGEKRRGSLRADVREGVAPVRPGHQSEGEKQRERAEARHEKINGAGARKSTTARKKAASGSTRKWAPIQGSPKGGVTAEESAPVTNAASTLVKAARAKTRHAT